MNIFLIECEYGLDVEDLYFFKWEEQYDLFIYGYFLCKVCEFVFCVDYGCYVYFDVFQVEII